MSEIPGLDEWVSALSSALGVDVGDVDIDALLDTAGDAARGVVRPAAPVSLFIVGLAAAKSGDLTGALALTRSLAQNWSASK